MCYVLYMEHSPRPPHQERQREDGQYSSLCWLNHLLQAPGRKSPPQGDLPSNAGHPSSGCLAQLILSAVTPNLHIQQMNSQPAVTIHLGVHGIIPDGLIRPA